MFSRRAPWSVAAACVVLALAACGPVRAAPPSSALATSGGVPVTAVQGGTFFAEPDDGVQPIVTALDGARHVIDFTMYLFTDTDVIDALKRAERRGVKVRGMLEQHPYESPSGNNAIFRELQSAGVDVRWTDPKFKLTHEKAFVIDGQEALILTLNTTHSAVTRNREFGVADRNPADAAEVDAAFIADWNRTTFAPAQPRLIWSPINARSTTVALMGEAHKTLDVFEEEMQDQQSEEALVAAARRGVAVRVVTTAPSGSSDSDASGIATIERGGVQVHRIKSPYVHAKAMVVDGSRLFIGSENMSASSLDDNRELGLVVDDAAMAQRVESDFAHDWSVAH